MRRAHRAGCTLVTRGTTVHASFDNPTMSSLEGVHAALAQSSGRVRRYPPEVSPLMAMPLDATVQDWDDAAGLLAGGTGTYQAPSTLRPPDGWRVLERVEGWQMAARAPIGAPDVAAEVITGRDAPEVAELVRATRPGPFGDRTTELGTYLGLRSGGRLVAMAGERSRGTGWTEISAVCTAQDHRGRGLAERLTRAVAALIEARGQVPVLQVAQGNVGAEALYRRVGFDRLKPFVAMLVVQDRAG